MSYEDLPLYRCHKVVRAAKIIGMLPPTENGPIGALSLALQPAAVSSVVRSVEAAFFAKHTPEVGGYFVVYEDGYLSYSPAKAFEEGYTRLDA